MQCCRAKLEGAEHFVHHTHFAGSQSRRMGRHQNTGGTSFSFAAESRLHGIQTDLPFRYCRNSCRYLLKMMRNCCSGPYPGTGGDRAVSSDSRRKLQDHSRASTDTLSRHADSWATCSDDGVASVPPMMRNSSTTVRWRNCPQKYNDFYRL